MKKQTTILDLLGITPLLNWLVNRWLVKSGAILAQADGPQSHGPFPEGNLADLWLCVAIDGEGNEQLVMLRYEEQGWVPLMFRTWEAARDFINVHTDNDDSPLTGEGPRTEVRRYERAAVEAVLREGDE